MLQSPSIFSCNVRGRNCPFWKSFTEGMWISHKLCFFSCIIISKTEKQTLNIEVHTKYCILIKYLTNNFIYVDLEFHYVQWISGWGGCSPSVCALVIKVEVWMAVLRGAIPAGSRNCCCVPARSWRQQSFFFFVSQVILLQFKAEKWTQVTIWMWHRQLTSYVGSHAMLKQLGECINAIQERSCCGVIVFKNSMIMWKLNMVLTSWPFGEKYILAVPQPFCTEIIVCFGCRMKGRVFSLIVYSGSLNARLQLMIVNW